MNQPTSSGMVIFPFYVCIDVSTSMKRTLPTLNAELPALKRAVEDDPIVGELARFGLVAFSDEAQQVMPLSDLAKVDRMPVLSAGGSTSYARAFELLVELLPHDMEWYRQNGCTPLRPVVFFITDGKPNPIDPWREWLATLTAADFRYRPHIVAFGFGSVDPATVAQVGTFRAYAAHEGHSPSQVLQTITAALTDSIVASATPSSSGEFTLAIPREIHGMYEIRLDVV